MLKGMVTPAIGEVDGVNVHFRTSGDYVPGSTLVFLNGFVLRRDSSGGWVEHGASKIQLMEAPRPGDDLQVYFRPR